MFAVKRALGGIRGEVHRVLTSGVRPGGRILTYHSIDTEVDGDRHRIYNMNRSTFEQSIFTLIDLSSSHQGLELRRFGSAKGSGITITFDDGYLSTLTIAAPLLAQLRIPFHVFVSPALIQSDDRRYLDRAGLKELSRFPNASVGAHGYDHLPISDIPSQMRLAKLTSARQWLEDVIQLPVRTMSYPFGDTPRGVRHDVEAAGYEVAACSVWGTNDETTDPLMLKRMDIWNGDSRRVISTKILGHWYWMARRTSK